MFIFAICFSIHQVFLLDGHDTLMKVKQKLWKEEKTPFKTGTLMTLLKHTNNVRYGPCRPIHQYNHGKIEEE